MEQAKFLTFVNGYGQIRKKDITAFKSEVLRELGYTTWTAFYQRKNGRIDLTVREKEIIERVFAKYGVTENIWGDDNS